MENFKSDQLSSASSSYAYIPTGVIIMLGSAFSTYSDTQYEDLGLVPCDGRSLDGTQQKYLNLWNVIGNIYGGTTQSSFNLPNLKDDKVSILGSDISNPVGTKVLSPSHYHAATQTNNNYVVSNANITHDHNVNYGGSSWKNGDSHSHNQGSAGGPLGPNVNKNGAAGTAGGGLVGNHSHSATVYFNLGSTGGDDHYHNAFNTNLGNAGDASHSHSISITASTNSNYYTSSSSALDVPYANVLYFIKL